MGFLNFLYSYSTYGNYGNYGNYGGFNNPSTTNTDWAALGGILGGVLAALGIMLIFILAAVVLMIIANWILFKKMGIEGWKSLIPYVKDYLQMEKTGVDQRWLLIVVFGMIVCIIPILGFIAYLVAAIYFYVLYMVSLARSFDKTDGFAVGLILLPIIFVCILAFGDSKYVGPRPMNDVIFKNKKEAVVETKEEKKTETKTKKASDSKKFCPECGAPIANGDAFCNKCGAKLK